MADESSAAGGAACRDFCEIAAGFAKAMVEGNPTTPMNDTLRRVLAGERDAFREIIREHAPMVRAFLGAHLRDFHTAEDLAQEVFVAVYANLRSHDGERPLAPWIRAVARNKLNDHLRRRYAPGRVAESLRADILENLAEEPDDGRDAERIAHLKDCVEARRAADRSLVRARYFERESVGDIARRLATTESAVSSKLYHLKAALRDCMDAKHAEARA